MKSNLINKKYGKKFQDHLLEQYKLYAQTTENVALRRDSTNRYFISINAILFSTAGYLTFNNQNLLPIFISIAGISANFLWRNKIQSYKSLNSEKFKLINELEKFLPAKLFGYEWIRLGRGQTKKYRELTDIEKIIPLIFQILYSAFISYSIFVFLQ